MSTFHSTAKTLSGAQRRLDAPLGAVIDMKAVSVRARFREHGQDQLGLNGSH